MKGIWDTVSSIVSQFGISADTAAATAKAFAEPSISNINAVTAAFQAEGTTPPPELMNELWNRYYSQYAMNPTLAVNTFSSYLPWILGGAAVYFLFIRKK